MKPLVQKNGVEDQERFANKVFGAFRPHSTVGVKGVCVNRSENPTVSPNMPWGTVLQKLQDEMDVLGAPRDYIDGTSADFAGPVTGPKGEILNAKNARQWVKFF